LKKLERQQTIEWLTFELNAKTIEMTPVNELQNARVSYDKDCEIIFRNFKRRRVEWFDWYSSSVVILNPPRISAMVVLVSERNIYK